MLNDSRKTTLTALHVACFRHKRIGGPYRSVPALVSAQQKLGLRVALLTVAGWERQKESFPVFCTENSPFHRQLLKLPEPFDSPDLINFHSYYVSTHALLAWEAHRRSIPYIVTPRGSMTKGALSQKRLKKILGNLLFQDRMISKAAAIHCLTEAEAVDARKWGRPTFVVPNGTELEVAQRGPAVGAEDREAELHLLFLGRLAINHKGLDLLLEGLSAVRRSRASDRFRLLLVGPDHNDSRAQLEDMVQRLELTDAVEFLGPLVGQAKEKVFQRAHLFVHTSRFEGMPLSVLEALARGLPCLLTPGTNLADLVAEEGAGWCAKPSAAGIASALSDILSNRIELPNAGRAARMLAEREFNWMHIAKKMVEYYEKITNQNK